MFISSSVISQEMYFQNISNTLNLPSQECYNVIQDSKGYIWICTENGLIKYSKGTTKLFDKHNGLDENAVYFIAEKPSGAIELLTSGNRILNIENDLVIEDPISAKLKEFIRKTSNEKSFNTAYLINKKDDDEIVINTQQRTIVVSKDKKNIIDYTRIFAEKSKHYFKVDISNKEKIFYKAHTISSSDLEDNNFAIDVEIVSGNQNKTVRVQLAKYARLDWRTRICNLKGFTFLTIHNVLLRIDKDMNVLTIPFPSVITSINSNNKHGLWIGTSAYGAYHYPDVNNMNIYTQGLNGLTVSSVFVDKEGGTWCTTTEKGVYYSANYSVIYFPNIKGLTKKTTLFKTVGNQLFFSSEIDKLHYLKGDKLNPTKLPETGNSDLTDICTFKGKVYIASKGYFGQLNKNFGLEKIINNVKGNVTVYQLDTSANNLYILGLGAIYKLDGMMAEMLAPSLKSKGRCFKVINDTIIYVGCNDGLYKLNIINQTTHKIDGINSAITKIILSKDGYLYFTTRGQGLFKLINDVAKQIDLIDNCLTLNDLIEDENNVIWISSNEGLIALKNNGNKYVSEKYNVSNGILSNSIGQLSICNDFLYVSSPDGTCMFSINKSLANDIPPKLYLNQIVVNDSTIKVDSEKIELDYYMNSIAVIIDQINYKIGKQECILYNLTGQTKGYKKVNTNKLTFENLPPDNYELTVYAVNNDGIRSASPLIVKFTILPPFWKTLWFIILIIIVFLFVVLLIVRAIVLNIKRKEEEKTKINKLISESQLSALQAQMNPHFIFNAINSIQNYILDKNEKEAYNYLSKFSKLIRKVLNNSKHQKITLKEEIETLNLYIDIEKLRFENGFDFELTIGEGIDDSKVNLPTMIIQPFVENSIWHGINNLKGIRRGHIEVKVNREHDILVIKIEDNGVGRTVASKYKQNDVHQSEGLNNTKKRISLSNQWFDDEFSEPYFEDILNSAKEVVGTRVIVRLKILEKL